MRHRRGTLPIRRWLALALAVTFLVPVLVTTIVAFTAFGPLKHTTGQAADLLRSGAARWNDPAWQAATRQTLASKGIDFVLLQNGRTIYQSRRDLTSGTDAGNQGTVERLVIAGRPRRIAYISSSRVPWGGSGGSIWLLPVVGFGTLLLMLCAITWFLGRTLVMPLAATGEAARQIAAGDLDIALYDSRVYEVAELNAAFLSMSDELRASLRRQAAIEEERRLFISAIAHDLRTPLFSLRGHLAGLEDGVATTSAKIADYVHICREKADALERLVIDLFAYARIEYLEQTVRRAPLDAGTLLGRTVEGRQREAGAGGVTLELDSSRQALPVDGDEQLLVRVMENLLDNALRYTPTGGTVMVRWWGEQNRAMFAVTDTGPGIEPRDLQHLFEPMYRADPSRSRETGGTGLGLAIARRIMRVHGGDLCAANRAGSGAEFVGSLPLKFEVASPSDSSARQGEAELATAPGDR
jgi:signal transduction histidine kinase